MQKLNMENQHPKIWVCFRNCDNLPEVKETKTSLKDFVRRCFLHIARVLFNVIQYTCIHTSRDAGSEVQRGGALVTSILTCTNSSNTENSKK